MIGAIVYYNYYCTFTRNPSEIKSELDPIPAEVNTDYFCRQDSFLPTWKEFTIFLMGKLTSNKLKF